MAQRGPWSTFAQSLQTVAAGATQTFVIALPSIPHLDEPSRSPGFDLLNVYVAAQVGTVVANAHLQPADPGCSRYGARRELHE